jgi:phenylacetic acid degradation operon negative regulatory protein
VLREGARPWRRPSAFAIRSLLIHAYRRLQLHDPMLPIELLPDPWPGSDAYAVARAMYLLVYAQAEVHIDAVLGARMRRRRRPMRRFTSGLGDCAA